MNEKIKPVKKACETYGIALNEEILKEKTVKVYLLK